MSSSIEIAGQLGITPRRLYWLLQRQKMDLPLPAEPALRLPVELSAFQIEWLTSPRAIAPKFKPSPNKPRVILNRRKCMVWHCLSWAYAAQSVS